MKQEIDQILKNNQIDKIKFYHHKSPLTNNIFTACLFLNSVKNQIVARGVSICSLRDSFNKSKGKHKAFGRAVKAVIHKKNTYKIRSNVRKKEYINRRMKFKTEQEFNDIIIPELLKINPELAIKISKINNTSTYSFKLPINYPIMVTNIFFKYKSSYLPNVANGRENKFLLDKKNI